MNERLSLQDLIDLLAKKQELTKKDAETFLRELIAVISENIEGNEPVKIKDFGVFKLVKVNTRKSVDVNTGVAIEIPAHYKLSFIPDKSLKEIVNRPFSHFESVLLEDGVTFDNIETEEKLSIAEDEEGTVEDDVSAKESEANIQSLIIEPSTSGIEGLVEQVRDVEEQSSDIVINIEEGVDTDVESVLENILPENNIISSDAEGLEVVEDVSVIHEEMIIDQIDEVESEIKEEEEPEIVEVYKAQENNASEVDFVDIEEASDTDVQSMLEDVLPDNTKSIDTPEDLISIEYINAIHEEVVVDPIDETLESEIQDEENIEIERAAADIESIILPVSSSLEVVDIHDYNIDDQAVLDIKSQNEIESREVLSRIEDVNAVPEEIINCIEEEAASKNVSKDKILLVVREDNVEDELVADEPKQKKLKRKYISLGVFVFLIIAGFIVGGMYFQKIASYLTTGQSNKDEQQVSAIDKSSKTIVAIPDTVQKEVQKLDSILAQNNTLSVAPKVKEEEKKPQQEPAKIKTEPKKEEKVQSTPAKVVNNSSSNIVTIQTGHTLRNIALTHYGNKTFWIYIYMENKSVIKNPNSIPIGTKLVIPYPSKYGIDAKNPESVEKAKRLESKQIASMQSSGKK